MAPARRNLLILLLAYALVVVLVVHQVRIDIAAMGSEWRQGDWLINAENGPVRRGLLGSGLIRLSDATGLSLLGLAFGVPLALLALLIASLIAVAVRFGPGDRLLLILLSPGFVLFWGADAEGTLRKELLIYAAFLPLLLASGRWALAASVAIYAVAAAGHEIAGFFAPALLLALVLCRPFDAASRLAMAAVALLAAATLSYARMHMVLQDSGPVCAPLLQRGLVSGICTGAIAWLAIGADELTHHLSLTLQRPALWGVPLAYAAALAPFFAALWRGPRPWLGAALILAMGLPFLPLWLLAIDWGRWINAHVAVLVFLALIGVRRFRPVWALAPLPPLIFWPVLLVCFAIGISHVGARLRPGLLETVVETFATGAR